MEFIPGQHKRTILIENKTSLSDMEVCALLFREFQSKKAHWGKELPKVIDHGKFRIEVTEATPVLKVYVRYR